MPNSLKPSSYAHVRLVVFAGIAALLLTVAAAGANSVRFPFLDSVNEFFGVQLTQASVLSSDAQAVAAPTPDVDAPLAGTTYTWNQTGTAIFTTAGNWTPARTTPALTDILVFNNGATTTATGVTSQTI